MEPSKGDTMGKNKHIVRETGLNKREQPVEPAEHAKPTKGWFNVTVDGICRMYNTNSVTWILPDRMCVDGRVYVITEEEYRGFLDSL